MATIFTVHGTRPKGAPPSSEHGDEWWQIGGTLDRELRSYVAADDDDIVVMPVVWDGANSELSRRKAGAELLSKTKEEDARGGRYVLIGHSHGGSVVLNAAIHGASDELFPKLACVLTVGTPFIYLRMSRFLFSRVGVLTKGLLLSVWMMSAAMVVYIFRYVERDGLSYSPDFIVANAFLLIFLIGYVVLRATNERNFERYKPSVKQVCRDRFQGNWHCLHDSNDEAIRGLSSLKNIYLNIFSRKFDISVVELALASIIPILVLAMILSQSAHRLIIAVVYDYGFMGIVFLYTVVVAVTLGCIMLIAPLSNAMTTYAIKQSLFGIDKLGEGGAKATDRPEWMEVSFKPLPADLSRKINDFSDEAAAKSIPRLRSAIEDLLKLWNVADPNKSVAEYLTWKELVHTSYFEIERFRMLVYYIIANSEGFKPTQAFLDDPDYELVARWHREIQPRAAEEG